MRTKILPVLVWIAAVLGLALAVRAWTPSRVDPKAPARAVTQPTRDDYEYTIFMKRGAWAVGLRPYLDVFSEYPPLATWAFGLPFFVMKPPAENPRAALAAVDSAAPHSDLARSYADLWALFMAVAWFGVAACTAMIAKNLQISTGRTFLLLGPACLFCALQRFDPLPALAVSGALCAFVSSRPSAGFAMLGVGVMLKIYPIVLFFLALGYVWRRHGWRAAVVGTLAFGAICVFCELPVFWSGVLDPSWTAKHRPARFAGIELTATPFHSGLAAVDVPFAYQGERDTNAGSLPERLFRGWIGVKDYADLLAGIQWLRILQFVAVVPAFFVGWLRPQPRVLVAASGALVTAFVLFHNIYSPQFHLWIAPLAIVAAGGRLGIAAAVCSLAVDVVTYLQFPILAPQAFFDPVQKKNIYPAAFWPMVDLRLLLTATLLVILTILALRRNINDAGATPRAGAAS